MILLAALTAPIPAWAQLWGSRARELDNIAPLLELRPGATIAEIGAGNGSVAIAAAERVGHGGHVYATEIDPKRLQQIRKAAQAKALSNLTVVESSADDTRLPAECCDAIYMIGVYHHFTDPLKTDASIFRALKPGGRLVIVDFRPSWLLSPWAPKGVPANRGGHGIPENILENELTGAGFQVTQFFDRWGHSWFLNNYCVVVTKPSAPNSRAAVR